MTDNLQKEADDRTLYPNPDWLKTADPKVQRFKITSRVVFDITDIKTGVLMHTNPSYSGAVIKLIQLHKKYGRYF